MDLNLLAMCHLYTFAKLLFISVSNDARFGLSIKRQVSSGNNWRNILDHWCTVEKEMDLVLTLELHHKLLIQFQIVYRQLRHIVFDVRKKK